MRFREYGENRRTRGAKRKNLSTLKTIFSVAAIALIGIAGTKAIRYFIGAQIAQSGEQIGNQFKYAFQNAYIPAEEHQKTEIPSTNTTNDKSARPILNLNTPEYPKHLLDKGYTGFVTFQAYYGANGQFIKAKLVSTSGRSDFDNAALKVISHSFRMNILNQSESDLFITCGFNHGLSQCSYK